VDRITKEKFYELNRKWHSRLPRCGNTWIGFAYGAIFEESIYAVAWWSHPVARMLGDGKTLELRRMAVGPDAPKCTASRFLAVMTRLIHREHPEVTRLVSYQDTEVHAGTIYKAAGWTPEGFRRGSEWACPSRFRPENQHVADKIRWEKTL
jgi:hypothetical protein